MSDVRGNTQMQQFMNDNVGKALDFSLVEVGFKSAVMYAGKVITTCNLPARVVSPCFAETQAWYNNDVTDEDGTRIDGMPVVFKELHADGPRIGSKSSVQGLLGTQDHRTKAVVQIFTEVGQQNLPLNLDIVMEDTKLSIVGRGYVIPDMLIILGWVPAETDLMDNFYRPLSEEKFM